MLHNFTVNGRSEKKLKKKLEKNPGKQTLETA